VTDLDWGQRPDRLKWARTYQALQLSISSIFNPLKIPIRVVDALRLL
jgi:hypothetical protein